MSEADEAATELADSISPMLRDGVTDKSVLVYRVTLELCERALSAAYAAGRVAGLREAQQSCLWTYDDIDDYYRTSCGQSYCLSTDGTLSDNRHQYCTYCGGKIEEEKNMNCPKCGRQMPKGVAHGPGSVQYECRSCNVFIPVEKGGRP